MESKINSRLFFMGILCMLLTASFILPLFRDAFYNQSAESIERTSEIISAAYNSGENQDLSVFAGNDFRITLIAVTGEVLYESTTSEPIGDHSKREEVVEAIRDGSAQSTRYSSTMGEDTFYCAVRLSDGNILRISQKADVMRRLYDKTMPIVVLFGFAIFFASIFLSVALTKKLIAPVKDLGSDLKDIESKIPYPEFEPFVKSISEYRLREEQNERQRKEFTANVSHELKTPLTSISGYAEMIENGMCRPEDVKVFGQRIHSEAARLIALVGDIIRLTQLDEADAPPVFEDVDLSDIAESTVSRLSLNAEKAGVSLVCGGSSAPMTGCPAILSEMVYNLCDNAIRYNKKGGHVWINTGSTGDGRVFIEVRDDGIGIPKSHQARIFERFYRVDKSHSRETGGTGLGLAIVKHAVSLHGGDIHLDSDEGKGTSVTTYFTESPINIKHI